MGEQAGSLIDLRVTYDGAGPVHWSGGPGDFGLQDKSGELRLGAPDPEGGLAFDFSLEVRPEGAAAPVFVGAFAHGPPGDRFLYLSWRNPQGGYAQRLKLPLGSIGWDLVRQARAAGQPLACILVDKTPRATSTGANIGGTRRVLWSVVKQ